MNSSRDETDVSVRFPAAIFVLRVIDAFQRRYSEQIYALVSEKERGLYGGIT